jgi:cytochrome c peroxidase
MGRRNAPSTYHAFGHFTQFWDGRASTVEEQARVPIENPLEMGLSAEEAVDALRQIEGYDLLFARAFPQAARPISIDSIAAAIGAFERGLITPSRWDRYLEGDASALSALEKEGAKVFANTGCLVCHTGPYLGGSMFEKLGARQPWPDRSDLGRREVTGNPADDMVFKVPSLRNVSQTAPYFHDGSAATLRQAIRLMAVHQLGVDLLESEVVAIESWLGSLTGDIPRDYIAEPPLPGRARR